MEKLFDAIKLFFQTVTDKNLFIEQLRSFISKELSEHKEQPIDNVKWIPLNKVEANDYNPNQVAINELRLLYTSIKHDGYTQPIVTIYDKERDKYIIVDGFHRHLVMLKNKDIFDLNNGKLPCVVIDKEINDRMASTIRHNRARGKHQVSGMADMVFKLLDNGWNDENICKELGLEAEELLRLKHITGFSKLFENVNYRKSWETKKMLQIKKDYEQTKSSNPTDRVS